MDILLAGISKNIHFNSPRGLLSIQQVYQLPLTSKNSSTLTMNRIAQIANEELQKSASDIDFVNMDNAVDATAKLRMDIILSLIQAKSIEVKSKEADAEKKSRKAYLEGLLAEKEQKADLKMTKEQIERELATLG